MNNLNIENIDTKQIIEKLNTMLKPKRLEHSINVAKCAIKLSEIYGYDKEKAYLAGLVHDCAKYFTKEKIIFMADMIEEGRNFPGVDYLRELSFNKQLDKALITSFNNTIKFVIDNDQLIHPRSVKARNYLMQENI